MRLPLAAFSLASLLLACGTAASNGEPAARVAEPAASAGPASCETVADCAGKPFRPNVEMCMRGSTVQLQCRDHLCVQACATAAP